MDYSSDQLTLVVKAMSALGLSAHWETTTPGQPPHDDQPMNAAEHITVAHGGSFDGRLSSLPYGCAAASDVSMEWIAAFETVWGDVAGPQACVTRVPGASLERGAFPEVVYYDLTGKQSHDMIEASKKHGREVWVPPRYVSSIDSTLAHVLSDVVAAKPELQEGLASILMACAEANRCCDVAVYSPGARPIAPSVEAGPSGVVTVYPATGPLTVSDCPPELRRELEGIAPDHTCTILREQVLIDDMLSELASLQEVSASYLPAGLCEIATFADVRHPGDGFTPCAPPYATGTMVVVHEPTIVEHAFLLTGSQYHPSHRTGPTAHDGTLQELLTQQSLSSETTSDQRAVEWLELRDGVPLPARFDVAGRWLITRVRDTGEATRLANELARLTYAPQ